MSVQVAAGNHQTYRANEHDTVLSEVADVHCVLMPRALLVAGYDTAGAVIMIRSCSYAATDPAWSPDFFEHEFINEPLLGVPQQVKALFIGSREELIIPDRLYDESAARSWMESIQAICPDDVLHASPVPALQAQYAFALPARMDKLLHRYFGHTVMMPAGAYQLHKPATAIPHLMQCLISDDTVIASLHSSGKLLWHQQFAYTTVEDIAWQAAQVCRELHIPRVDLQVECCLLSEERYDLAPELERFFPKIRWTTGAPGEEGHWAPVLYLLKQLYACAL